MRFDLKDIETRQDIKFYGKRHKPKAYYDLIDAQEDMPYAKRDFSKYVNTKPEE